jgi:SAM-dependent methyltransferase
MPSLLGHAAAWLRAPGNQLAYAVRSRLRRRRGHAVLPREPVADWCRELPAAARTAAAAAGARLRARFDLDALAAQSTRLVYAENLALLDRLEALRHAADSAGWPVAGAAVAAVDVGCGAFQYATALHRWLATAGSPGRRPVALLGVEIDGYGRYRDGATRADHAAAHAALAGGGTRFSVADFQDLELPPQDVVTLFYPFLSAYPLLRWGSPLHHLRPRSLLARAVAAVRPGGVLVVVNQTEAEHRRLLRGLADQPVRCLATVPFASALVPYAERTAGRVGTWWQKQALP